MPTDSPVGAPFTFANTGSLNVARYAHTATLLSNGKVLVAVGATNYGVSLTSAELYDPALGTWTPTGNLNTTRLNQTATMLRNGKVLVAGGNNRTSGVLYERGNCTTRLSGAGRRPATWQRPLSVHTAMLLPNGKVLAARRPGQQRAFH